ncbi:MAG: L-histidine N(alpha)-methyltransferase [Candidatus Eremiobacteraeota bacterium]|nr:L-histidine N(alpha)-methyltransferase [Candidatus Eremiobacteraeota bacterium]MBV9263488.1 L-histidine N(alpha)-methyltransferase [Candidatus Eremiobacteraeota bacterium]
MLATAVADRFELVTVPPLRGVPSFAEDVASGLRATPKRLSSKYLYDDVGSALFDAITRLPEYYLTRAENEILVQWGWQIVRMLDAPLDFLELGSGSAAKTRRLIGEALRLQAQLRYSPIDISSEAIRTSSLALVESFPGLSVRAYAGDYFDVLRSCELYSQRKMLAMFMGSNIGNYEPDHAAELLTLLHDALRPGDGLLVGADLKKDPATLELAYDDPAGVTAAFNLNLLARINRELDGTFDVRRFRHVASYDERRGSVDSYLEAVEKNDAAIGAIGLHLSLRRGERIQTESSYKFGDEDLIELGKRTGFRAASAWHDGARRFIVRLFVRES